MRTSVQKILIAESSVIIAEGLKHILEASGDYRISGTVSADSAGGLEDALDRYDADIVILDPSALGQDIKAEVKELVRRHLDIPVIGIISTAADAAVSSAFDACIYLQDKADDILAKVSEALSAAPSAKETPKELEELSTREKEILVCVAKGMLNKEIADKLSISIYTVITHRKNITRKTGIKTVAGLTVYALLGGLIDMNSIE